VPLRLRLLERRRLLVPPVRDRLLPPRRDRLELGRLGTLPPSRRASLRPIAIAWLRLRTVLPERPLLSWPRFISCIARSTFADAFFPYLAMLETPKRGGDWSR